MTNPPAPPAPRERGKATTFLLITMAVVIAVLVGWRIFGRSSDAAYQQLVSENSTAQVQLGGSQTLAAEKDSLTNELLETTSLITDISQAVTAVQTGGAAPILSESGAPHRPMTAAEARAFLLPKIDSLRLRLRAAESKLAASEARVRQIPATAKLQAQIARYEANVATMRKLVASQQEQLGSLTTEVTALRSENAKLLVRQSELVATQHVLQDSVVGLKEDENTVYWIAGSKAHLLELHVVTEEGSGKVLVFGKGKSLAAARTLSATDFAPVNKRESVLITLPKPAMRYRILTRQDLTALENPLDKEGHVRGTLRIRDPLAFWAPSPYLILVEDN